ncbi:MAG: hypothetical protein E7466_02215 [Ruminococcaceae bacterium]|nr:hypothetical protein [Oscillospiraceae bacterium]MBQ3215088.1 AAA family ATPase [Oscillospiraceae bacterium]
MSISEIKETKSEKAVMEKNFTFYLSDFWRGLMKFWWLVVGLALLLGSFSFYNSYIRYVPTYTSSATFTVHMENETITGDGGMSAYSFFYDRTTADQLAIVFPYIMQSNILQDRVCRDMNVTAMPASVSVSCVAGTNMLTISTTGSDPQATYDVLQSVINNYSYVAEYIIGPTKLNPISTPEVPTAPTNAMQWKTETLKSVVIGLVIGLVWIAIYAVLRQTVRTKEDVQRELRQPCLGVLPQVTFKRYKQKIDTSVLLSNPLVGKEYLESMRLLRSSIQSNLQDNEKVILLTSTAPGEGKSVTTLNLAYTLAKSDEKVLVIDGDLRNSGISRMVSSGGKKQQNDTSDQIYDIVPLEKLGVDVLTFRAGQRQLWKIMRANRLGKILKQLRKEYDLILIDTPPCGIISDAIIMANVADVALYIVRQDTVLSSRIRRSMSSLLSTDARVVGCVLNGALGGLAGYGNRYGYGGYSHYYRYGYYSKEKTTK